MIFRLFSTFKDYHDSMEEFNSPGPLNIVSVRIMKDRMNLENQIAALSALDTMLSMNEDRDTINVQNPLIKPILKELFADISPRPASERKLYPYIYDTFHCFRKHKTKIEIELGDLIELKKKDKKGLVDMLFYDLGYLQRIQQNSWEKIEKSCNKEQINLMRPCLFEIFGNVKEIYINAYDLDGAEYPCWYPFSLLSLLSIIGDTVDKITIDVMEDLWTFLKSSLVYDKIVDKYKTRGFVFNQHSDDLIIYRR